VSSEDTYEEEIWGGMIDPLDPIEGHECSGSDVQSAVQATHMDSTTTEVSDVRRGEWHVSATGTTTRMIDKWSALLQEWDWSPPGTAEWPHCVIGSGTEIAEAISTSVRQPEWVIVDGGELHRRSVDALKTRHLKKWSVRGSLSVWAVHVEKDHVPRRHKTIEKMLERLQASVQARLRKAYNAVGGTRFKSGMKEEDFSFTGAMKGLAANPMDQWGNDMQRHEWAMQRKWDWPNEPPGGGFT
jgi:hypothetical protein